MASRVAAASPPRLAVSGAIHMPAISLPDAWYSTTRSCVRGGITPIEPSSGIPGRGVTRLVCRSKSITNVSPPSSPSSPSSSSSSPPPPAGGRSKYQRLRTSPRSSEPDSRKTVVYRFLSASKSLSTAAPVVVRTATSSAKHSRNLRSLRCSLGAFRSLPCTSACLMLETGRLYVSIARLASCTAFIDIEPSSSSSLASSARAIASLAAAAPAFAASALVPPRVPPEAWPFWCLTARARSYAFDGAYCLPDDSAARCSASSAASESVKAARSEAPWPAFGIHTLPPLFCLLAR
mmetsp:Transcript_6553/g.19719  ORF Transcript_6553/g.19719 Transcript_6553/m.19719 type:complete len:293 (+) Transcript_6553:222-1100(+)